MKRKDFIDNITEMGIKPENYGVYVDELCRAAYGMGIYCDNGEWVVYKVDERNNIFESVRGDEDIAFDSFFRKLFVRLDDLNYINYSITKDIVKTTRTVIFDYFRRKYQIEDNMLEDTWNYLLQDFDALNNLKYYVVNDSFVPKEDAYVVEGYTAQRIYEETNLNELEAHKYLVYLRLEPEQALNDLKIGVYKR